MAKRVYDDATLVGIADAIRQKTGGTASIPVTELASEIAGIEAGGGARVGELVGGTILDITEQEMEGVTEVRKYAFYHLYSLNSIVLPESVTSIGEYAFYRCENLTRVVVKSKTPPTAGTGLLMNCYKVPAIVVPDGCAAAYKAATNWSARASQIIEESEAGAV